MMALTGLVSSTAAAPARRSLASSGLARVAQVARHCEGLRLRQAGGSGGSASRLGAAQLTASSLSALAVLTTTRRHSNRGCLPSACSSNAADHAAADGDTVFVAYTGKLEDGTVFDSSKEGDPLCFTVGKGQVVPGFEAAVRGLSPGNKISVKLPPAEAYGEHNEVLVVTLPAAKAPAGLAEGMEVQMQTTSGRAIPARVIKVSQETGDVTVDANPSLAGKTLLFDIELLSFREALAPSTPPEGMELATVAAGCFWGVELAFQRVPGVVSTCVGYAQGHMEHPSYEDVCGKQTGHTEAVRIVFNPKEVSYEELLSTLWERIGRNATTLNRAGNDVGPQYRSGIYFHSPEQEAAARRSVEGLEAKLGERVVTEVEAAAPFWVAEHYHQQYLEKGRGGRGKQSAEKSCTETIRCYG